MSEEDRYLVRRGEWWHYVRRVPAEYEHVDRRGMVRQTLKTQSIEAARMKRDVFEQADNQYWSSLVSGDHDRAKARYQAAVLRARALNLSYQPVSQIAADAPLTALLDRVEQLPGKPARAEAEAVLGTAPRPAVKLSQALEIYFDEIAIEERRQKSAGQWRKFKNAKRHGIGDFIALEGDLVMSEITRDHALAFHKWYVGRLMPADGSKGIASATAKRGFGNVRKLYGDFYRHVGERDRVNPFRDLAFSGAQESDVPPFPVEWIVEKIIAPGALAGLNEEARHIVYAMVETGCRPSEIANLTETTIVLDGEVPHIRIRPDGREVKTRSSRRDIPLVGVSLEALRRAPGGFPRYRDNEGTLSALLSKFFRNNGLLPTPAHRPYSLRHAFEDRMKEGGLDYELRCHLMGHATDRPDYGEGGGLAWRRDQLMKITLPFDSCTF